MGMREHLYEPRFTLAHMCCAAIIIMETMENEMGRIKIFPRLTSHL